MNVGRNDSLRLVAGMMLDRWRDPEHRRKSRLVRQGLSVPRGRGKSGGIWAISMVKNEADILESTIRHQFSQGIDRMLIVDNGSSDGTLELIEGLSNEFPITLGIDREPAYFQAHKMTALASRARVAGAEWVIPFDADEFWYAPDMKVVDYLRSSEATRIEATLYNAFPTTDAPKITGINTGTLRLDLAPHELPKVATKTHPFLWIGMGNHSALRPGLILDGLHIVHVPWRSAEQFKAKIRQGASALRSAKMDTNLGSHWRHQDAKSDDELSSTWEQLLEGNGDRSLGWHPVGPFREIDFSDWGNWKLASRRSGNAN